ncbi:multidrug ABC transporter [Olsenella sp. An290]|uniref:multidrug ABC transporter n=1 Tax=Olsenella sp. An290 TaxID=1965625 RepID=UPI000B37F094|nr:multidrug ABC transporter [Olsenella sp. An290]OUO34592.1 multidrug ABC transporter [Olsenella sp. An290]
MNPELPLFAGIYLVGVFISAVSQVLLKKSAMKKYDSVVAEYLNPRVIAAYSIFVCATLLTIVSYKVVPLSLGPILEATSYIYVTIFGVVFFGERVTPRRCVALALILGGILIYSLSM